MDLSSNVPYLVLLTRTKEICMRLPQLTRGFFERVKELLIFRA